MEQGAERRAEFADRGLSDHPIDALAPGGAVPPGLDPDGVLSLQRSAGNAAVRSLVDRAGRTPALSVQREVSVDQAGRIAERLHDAMKGWGTDEEAIYGALSGRSQTDVDAITLAYKKYSEDGLDADLKDELTDSEYAHVKQLLRTAPAATEGNREDQWGQRTTRAKDVATQLKEAMEGWGTEEDQIFNALEGREPYEIVEIAREYTNVTGRAMLDDLRDDLTSDEMDRALGLLRVMKQEGEGPHWEIGGIQQALNGLGAAPQIRVTGLYGPETTTAVNAFQAAHPPLRADGKVNLETWLTLDRLAPRLFRSGRLVIESAVTPAESRGVPLSGTVHPTVRKGSKGAAVEELQQKLLTIPAAEVPTRVTASGTFDDATRAAVKEFQASRSPAMKDSGVADKETWAAVDAVAGPVTVGREEFSWEERTEGQIMGADSKFTWRLLPDKLQVKVNIKFTGAPKHPMVTTWKEDITSTWNSFKFVDDEHPGTSLPLEFVVGSDSPADASVRVRVEAVDVEDPGRSDAANWYTSDQDHGMAPHEFGHLIGLRDEYNQGPEALTAVTGEVPFLGPVDAPTDDDGNPVSPEVIATEIRAAVTSSPANRRGRKAAAIVEKYGLVQGSFSQRIAAAYEKANAGKLLREDFSPSKGYHNVDDLQGSMANDLNARIPRAVGNNKADEGEAAAVDPFLYSNRSLMGTMESKSDPIGPHDHPIAERHVRHFAEIVGRNRPGKWRIVR